MAIKMQNTLENTVKSGKTQFPNVEDPKARTIHGRREMRGRKRCALTETVNLEVWFWE
jgi:hypothetical protein